MPHARTRSSFREMPRQNPCAQCGAPIALPEWIEEQEGSTVYLWHCHACDYRFEATAFYEDAEAGGQSLAA